MGGIELLAESIGEELRRRLPGQRKTQRENLALLAATMLDVRSANLMELTAALSRTAERIDMRYEWIERVLANPLIDCDTACPDHGAGPLLCRFDRAVGSGQPPLACRDQASTQAA